MTPIPSSNSRYVVEHKIEFRYDAPVHLSVTTLYLHPIQDRGQDVREFSLRTDPPGTLFQFVDAFGNRGHFMDRPALHERMAIHARSDVEVGASKALPDRLGADAWTALRQVADAPEFWAMTHASRFVRPDAPMLGEFMSAHGVEPEDDPLATVRTLRAKLHETFRYAPGATAVDSPIERILETGEGVCQDYAHVMASILRRWGIPCRYVSGYLGPGDGDAATGQSHAWVECWLPEVGWTGFDPTNDTDMDGRHVRVAVGRDYADVPPTRGVFQGAAASTLETTVAVARRAPCPETRGGASFDGVDSTRYPAGPPSQDQPSQDQETST